MFLNFCFFDNVASIFVQFFFQLRQTFSIINFLLLLRHGNLRKRGSDSVPERVEQATAESRVRFEKERERKKRISNNLKIIIRL